MSDGPKRRLLKISGEVLGGDAAGGRTGAGVEASALARICAEIAAGVKAGVQVGLVVGGGNFLRGAELDAAQVDRNTAHHMGMLATVMNGLAVRDGLAAAGVESTVYSAIPAGNLPRMFSAWDARADLEAGRVAILSGGVGNPFVTTDTGAAVRAIELQCDLLLKGTKVAGVFSADPKKDPEAKLYDTITFEETLQQKLAVMDQAAFALCRENQLPIRIFDMIEPGNISRALVGDDLGTLICP